MRGKNGTVIYGQKFERDKNLLNVVKEAEILRVVFKTGLDHAVDLQ